MRILFVTPYVPSLIRVRPLNFIKQLGRRHRVTLVSLATGERSEDEAIEAIREHCEQVHVIRLRKAASVANCCRRLLTAMPLQAAYTEFEFARRFIERLVSENRFDVVHVEHIRGAGLVSEVPGVPRIYDSVDCITRLLKQRASREKGFVKHLLSLEELLKMRSYEARTAASFDGIAMTCDADKRALQFLMRRYAGEARQISVIRNGVDSDYFQPREDYSGNQEIVFSGKMSYFPNVMAVTSFYHEVLPRIRKQKPNVRFKILGSDPPEVVRKLREDPGVIVTGYVPDIRPHLSSAGVVVCPLSVGVGIQNKVLEAMSMGKAVVASPIACRGIQDAVDGKHLIRGEGAEGMASLVTSLLDRPEYAQTIGMNARNLVTRSYSWQASALALEDAYERAIGVVDHDLRYAA